MPNMAIFLGLARFVSIRTMATPAFATITSFKMVLFGKYTVAIGRPIEITLLDFRYIFHLLCTRFYKNKVKAVNWHKSLTCHLDSMSALSKIPN